MITFRPEQMEAMRQTCNREFVEKVTAFLKEEMKDAVEPLSPAELETFIHECQARAAPYGIEEAVPVTQFICLALALGVEFDQIPDVNAYLKSDSLNQTDKMQALVEELSEIDTN